MKLKKNILTILLLSFCSIVFAQKTQVYLDKEILYKTGIELFDKKQYTAAQKTFIDYMATINGNTLSLIHI